MTKLKIAVIIGTARKKRMTEHAAKLIAEVGTSFSEIEVVLVDPLDFDLPFDGNDEDVKDPKYTKITAEADGFFIVLPEYNHGYPGSLKRLLDSELKNYAHKPVAMGGVSMTPWGGTRAIESLVLTVREMGLVVTSADMNFPKVHELFDESGKLTNEAYRGYAEGAWEELIWMAKVLKAGKETIPNKQHQE